MFNPLLLIDIVIYLLFSWHDVGIFVLGFIALPTLFLILVILSEMFNR
jgi:hypothetical protein